MTTAISRWILLAACLAAAPAAAKPTAPVAPTLPAPVGLREIASFKPERGFIDDPVAVDGKGRLVFLETDASTFTTLVVVDDGKVRSRLPLGDDSDVPLAIALVGTGDTAQVFIVQAGEDGRQRGTLYDLRGKVVRRFGPAAEVTLLGRGPRPRVTLHRTRSPGRNSVKHQLDVHDLASGKRLGTTYSLDVDSAGRSDKLDFRINHWFDGWTRAVGTRGGRWDARADQRSPDVEAEYDLVAGKFVRTAPIPDVV